MKNDNPYALSEAQDNKEMFDVMLYPSPSFNMFSDRPMPSGISKNRGEVHRDGDWHRSVHIWLVDVDQSLLGLQKRSPNKDTFPGRWDISAAGHVEAGVTDSRETALRELAEELGIDNLETNKELKFIFTCPSEQSPLGGCNCFEDVYILERDSKNCPIVIGEAEVTDFKWMSIEKYESCLRLKDDLYVPRVKHYIDPFFETLLKLAKLKNSEDAD